LSRGGRSAQEPDQQAGEPQKGPATPPSRWMVLRRLGVGDVQDVVDGGGSEGPTGAVDQRDRPKPVPGHELGHRLLIRVGGTHTTSGVAMSLRTAVGKAVSRRRSEATPTRRWGESRT